MIRIARMTAKWRCGRQLDANVGCQHADYAEAVHTERDEGPRVLGTSRPGAVFGESSTDSPRKPPRRIGRDGLSWSRPFEPRSSEVAAELRHPAGTVGDFVPDAETTALLVRTVRGDATRASMRVDGELDIASTGILADALADQLSRGRRFVRLDVSGLSSATVPGSGCSCTHTIASSPRTATSC